MARTSLPELDQQSSGDTIASITLWVAAVGAAIALQVTAMVAALGAVAVVLLAAFEDWGNRDQDGTPAYVLLSIPLGLAAPSLFVASGLVAARIIGDRRGWWLLLLSPLAWGALRTITFALTL